jgi:hypothetical protein
MYHYPFEIFDKKGGETMKITIPEQIGGELRKLMGPCKATLEKIIIGKSKVNQPKATFLYTITEEMDCVQEGEASAIGEKVLETFSLQPQAIFKLNSVYKAATGEYLPQGDYDETQIGEMLTEALTGSEWNLALELQVPTDGSSTEERTTVVKREFIG